MEMAADAVLEQEGYDPRNDAADAAALADNAENAKRMLSKLSSFTMTADQRGHQVTVSQADFQAATEDLVEQTRALLREVLEQAESKFGLTRNDINVLLCGGATRMPPVRDMLEQEMGRPPLTHKDADLLVAIGAAYAAYLLGGDSTQPGVVAPTVTNAQGGQTGLMPTKDIGLGVGVEVVEFVPDGSVRKFSDPVIPRDAPYEQIFWPQRPYATAFANQNEIPIVLYEGGETEVENRDPMASLSLTGFPASLPQGTPVWLVLCYDRDGIVRGRARSQGQTLNITAQHRGSSRTPAETSDLDDKLDAALDNLVRLGAVPGQAPPSP
jgi:molecular chaperone DnaK (HSP70)